MPRHLLGRHPHPSRDPPNWTPECSRLFGSYRIFGGGLSVQDCEYHDFRVLEPSTSDASRPSLRTLGTEILADKAGRWRSGCNTPGELHRSHGQTDWIRFTLIRHGALLEGLGIYEAVLLSLFHYRRDTVIFRAFAERWSYISNTLFLEDRELTPTLWEIRELSGLPIYGLPYEELCPADLHSASPSSGHPGYSASLKEVFRIYEKLLGKRVDVSFDQWIGYFLDRTQVICPSYGDVDDPLGTQTPRIRSTDLKLLPSSVTSRDIDEEVRLTAFLSWWLCYFVVPCQPVDKIRPETFLIANTLACGKRVSLAIPALANIYSAMRVLVSSRDPSSCRAVVPFHFLGGWLHVYWSGLYLPSMSQQLRDVLPLLAGIANATVPPMNPTKARHFFFHSRERISPHRVRPFSRALSGRYDTWITDDITDPSKRILELEYLISLRPGWLPLRRGDRMILEFYQPHRCAHQFGYDQVIPVTRFRFDGLFADLECLAACWSAILRRCTGSRFFVPSAFRVAKFARAYHYWYHGTISVFQAIVPNDLQAKTCLSRQDSEKVEEALRRRKRDRSASSSTDASPARWLLDFSGLDSPISYAYSPGPSPHTGLFLSSFLFFCVVYSVCIF